MNEGTKERKSEGRKEEGMSGIEMAKFAFPPSLRSSVRSVPFFMVIQEERRF